MSGRRGVVPLPPGRLGKVGHARLPLGRQGKVGQAPPERRRAGWWLATARLLLIVDLVALLLVVLDAPYFKVSRIVLAGLERTEAADVLRVARLEGQNVLLLRGDRIARAVERLPTVKSARVTRALPNQVSIKVQERQPRAIWESKGVRYLVDDEGVVIGTGPAGDSLLVVEDTGGRALEPGARVDAQALTLAEKLARALPEDLGLEAQAYQYSWPAGMTVVTAPGWRLSFGYGDDFDFKLAVLKEVLQTARQRKAPLELVDVRSKERPYFR